MTEHKQPVYTEAYVPPTLFGDARAHTTNPTEGAGSLAGKNGYVPASVLAATSTLWEQRGTYWPTGLGGTPNVHDVVLNGWWAKPGAMCYDPWAAGNPAAGVVAAAHGVPYYGHTPAALGATYAALWGEAGRPLWEGRSAVPYTVPQWGAGVPMSADLVHATTPPDWAEEGVWERLVEACALLTPDRFVVLWVPAGGIPGSTVLDVVGKMRGVPGVRMVNEVVVVGPKPIPPHTVAGAPVARCGHILVYVRGARKAAATWVTTR